MREMYLAGDGKGVTLPNRITLEEDVEGYGTIGGILCIVVHTGVFEEDTGDKGCCAVVGDGIRGAIFYPIVAVWAHLQVCYCVIW